MNEVTVGKLITGDAERDAIHIAVAPCVAGERLFIGHKVVIKDGKAFIDGENPIGIVDPFLQRTVKRGERCWIFLYPNTVTGMRHHWSHPAFGEEDENSEDDAKDPDRVYVEEVALRMGKTYDALMEDAVQFAEDSIPIDWTDHIMVSESARDEAYAADWKIIWAHVKAVKSIEVPDKVPYSCSCC